MVHVSYLFTLALTTSVFAVEPRNITIHDILACRSAIGLVFSKAGDFADALQAFLGPSMTDPNAGPELSLAIAGATQHLHQVQDATKISGLLDPETDIPAAVGRFEDKMILAVDAFQKISGINHANLKRSFDILVAVAKKIAPKCGAIKTDDVIAIARQIRENPPQ